MGGSGQGEYAQETTYRYVGYGGDFDQTRARDFTCIITGCGLLALLLLIPLLIWLLMPDTSTREPFDCSTRDVWGPAKQAYCCANYGVGCPTTQPILTQPTTPGPTPITNPITSPITIGPTISPTQPTAPPPPGDPWNCAVDPEYLWCSAKKAWCCQHASKGCPTAGGCGTTRAPYDCNAGFSNWQAGWSVPKKAWCCQHASKGCPTAGGCA